MRLASTVVIVLSRLATSALGGIVTFDPPNPVVDFQNLPTTVSFEVTAAMGDTSPPNGVSFFDMIFDSDPRLDLINSFQFSEVVTQNMLLPPPQGPICDPGPCPIWVGAAFKSPQGPSLLIGTLSVRMPAGLQQGDYRVFVDSDYDQFSNLNGTEGLFGEAFIQVVPEPATGALLTFGLIAALLRRLT